MSQNHDLLVFSHLRWTFVWQRPQHLISRMNPGGRIWFIEEPVPSRVEHTKLHVEEQGPVTRVWLEVPSDKPHIDFGDEDARHYRRHLVQLLEHVTDPIVWIYTPMALDLAEVFEPSLMVYDVMDDLASFKGAPELLRLRFLQALSRADVVFTGGRSLHRKALRHRDKNTFLFCSGVEPEHFAVAKSVSKPEDTKVAGYVGVIDERLDLKLLGALAESLHDWEIQVVGPVAKIDPDILPRRDNIKYLGQKSYEDLPVVMGGFNVALMPFALNEATRSISPTKTLEYLAAGLPVVSTKVPDVVADHSSSVALCETASEFASACRALSQGIPETMIGDVRETVSRNDWDSIAKQMRKILDGKQSQRFGHVTKQPAARFDFLIVGAGFAGSVLAERLANAAGKRVLLIDKRNHIGGNAYDYYDDAGVLIHKYGPHIFHTNSSEVFQYLSQFTPWRPYEHRVLASVDGMLVPIPINLDTINRLYGMNLTSLQLDDFFKSVAEPVEHCRTSEDVVVSKVGRELYEKFFRNYTRKQWGIDPSELDASVTSRVPTRTNRDDRYFTDTFQAMPLHGYTRMFERMLSHPHIKIMLNTAFHEVKDLIPYEELIFTGPVDEYFDFEYGELPYRSLEFRFETRRVDRLQPVAVINYPSQHPYTRVTEFKHLTGQEHSMTTLVYEYPQAEGDPYYPVPQPQNALLYKKYKALADSTPGVHFVGRLATYKYYNMDQVTAQALAAFRRLGRSEHREPKVISLPTPEAAVVGTANE